MNPELAAEVLDRQGKGMTPRLWAEVGRQSKATDYERFKGMSVEEVYDTLLAQIRPLDAILKAVDGE